MPERKRLALGLRLLIILAGLLGLLVAAFLVWGWTPARPMDEALAALRSDDQPSYQQGGWLVFPPAGLPPETGLILYPGGRVDYRAYAPAAEAIASRGFLVVLVRMPLNLAVFDPGAAARVMAAFPEIEHWAVGGHSLGGAMAANFVYTHPGTVDGLVLWASYPAASNDLSTSQVQVLSISGSRDGLSTPEKIAASVPLLPPGTTWVPIAGGNHAGFGWYGPQAGDNPSEISREVQQDAIVDATVVFLQSLR